jgi:sigma-E factor negative regulatory protein RseC
MKRPLMLAERARVVALEPGVIWVETLSQSGCGSCAENGECGTGLLQRYLQTSQYLRIEIDQNADRSYQIGSELELGLDEGVMVRGSLLLYVMPLIGLLFGAGLGYNLEGEASSVLLGLLGMALAGVAVRWHANRNRFNPDYHPVILDQSVILSRN